jgi:hypothetical protein
MIMRNRSGDSVRLIGRVDALVDVRTRVERAARGLGGLILVGGEAGLGKTEPAWQHPDVFQVGLERVDSLIELLMDARRDT